MTWIPISASHIKERAFACYISINYAISLCETRFAFRLGSGERSCQTLAGFEPLQYG